MNHAPRFAMLLASLLILAGCGGSGGGDNNPPGGDPPPPDVTPDAFSLTDVENAAVDFHTASMTITGVNAPVKVRVCCQAANPEFSLDSGETWQVAPADAENGDVVMIRLHAKPVPGGVVNANLYVGGTSAALDAEGTVSDNFQVTTKADGEAPQVFIDFPPMRAATSTPPSGNLKVRGRAMDDVAVKSVTVNGLPATIDEETGEWIADYLIVDGMQTITATVEDTSGFVQSASVELERVRLGAMVENSYRLGEGEGGNVHSILANGLPGSPLLIASAEGLMKLDPETADRVPVEIPDVGGEITAIARMDDTRLLIANDDPAGETGIAIYDVIANSASYLPILGDFEAVAALPARSLAYHPKGLNGDDWILFFNSNFDLIQHKISDTYLFEAGAKDDFRLGAPSAFDVDYDPFTQRSYVSAGEDIHSEAASADDGVHMEFPDAQFVLQMAIDPVTGDAYGFDSNDGSILSIDLSARNVEIALALGHDCTSPSGPEVRFYGYEQQWDVDFERRIGYLSAPVAEGCGSFSQHQDEFVFAIDLKTGYRVLIAKIPISP